MCFTIVIREREIVWPVKDRRAALLLVSIVHAPFIKTNLKKVEGWSNRCIKFLKMAARADSVHSEDIDFLISALESDAFIEDDEFLNDIDILVKEIEKEDVAIEYVCTKCTKSTEHREV